MNAGRHAPASAAMLSGTEETVNPVWAVRDARNPALTFAHKAVLYAIASRMRCPDDEAYPGGETLAADAGGGDRQTRTCKRPRSMSVRRPRSVSASPRCGAPPS